METTIRTALAAALLALAGLPAIAADEPTGGGPDPSDRAEAATAVDPDAKALADSDAALRAIEATGRSIFEHDRAAAVATDVAMAQRVFKRDKRVRGWLTESKDGGIVVTFIDETPSALYRVLVSAEGEPSPLLPLDAPAPLSAFESGAATARRLASESPFQACSESYNTVVLPDAAFDGGWVVYLLPGTTRHDVVPLGGTYRMEVRDGAVTAQRGFTRSCIALNRGPNVGATMITHILDSVPTEAHVHWSLWSGTPMFVTTDGGIWKIEQGRVRALPRDED